MYQRILVANRGEIALRIIRACRELGVETVAIYSEGDRGARYLELADEAYCVGPAKAADSYLKIASVISAAEVGNVQAIHPGYGFLAENAHFNEICRSCNIDFIGPSPQAMARLGDKNAARDLARASRACPSCPAARASITSEQEALGFAHDGRLSGADQGGGRRRRTRHARRVERPGAQVGACSRRGPRPRPPSATATSISKNTSSTRGTSKCRCWPTITATSVHLWERDCSVQRRHQKLIEESPSTSITPETRTAMCDAARRLILAAEYTNAATVEFIVDKSGNFYFIEVNARIQVEHPVTEMVTGIDLIKWQIRIAAGERLPWSQEDILQRGAAIECRINAENPTPQFSAVARQDRAADRARRLRRAVRFARPQRLRRAAVLRLDDRQADRAPADAGRGDRLHAAGAGRAARRGDQDDRAAPPGNSQPLGVRRRPDRHDVRRADVSRRS